MAQLTIELPPDLDAKLKERIACAGYSNAQEYIQDLIAADANGIEVGIPERVVARTQEELEQKLLEGLNSGAGVEMTAADWTERRQKLIERHSKRAPL